MCYICLVTEICFQCRLIEKGFRVYTDKNGSIFYRPDGSVGPAAALRDKMFVMLFKPLSENRVVLSAMIARSNSIGTSSRRKKQVKRKRFWKRSNTCFSCHELGHLARDCPNKKSKMEMNMNTKSGITETSFMAKRSFLSSVELSDSSDSTIKMNKRKKRRKRKRTGPSENRTEPLDLRTNGTSPNLIIVLDSEGSMDEGRDCMARRQDSEIPYSMYDIWLRDDLIKHSQDSVAAVHQENDRLREELANIKKIVSPVQLSEHCDDPLGWK